MRDDVFLSVVRIRIRKARLTRNLSQEIIAERAQMPLRSYQRYEAQSENRPFSPSLRNMRTVARAIGVDLAELVTEPTDEEAILLEAEAETLPKRVKRSR